MKSFVIVTTGFIFLFLFGIFVSSSDFYIMNIPMTEVINNSRGPILIMEDELKYFVIWGLAALFYIFWTLIILLYRNFFVESYEKTRIWYYGVNGKTDGMDLVNFFVVFFIFSFMPSIFLSGFVFKYFFNFNFWPNGI